MRVLVTGCDKGQLHWELKRTVPQDVEWVGPSERLDITDAAAVQACVEHIKPDVLINAAAYTAVDAAEDNEPLAEAINASGVGYLASAAKSIEARMVHVSTDFVFGTSNGSPFLPSATPDPVSVYGKTKLAGEQALQKILPESSLIFRTAWVYSSHGNNYVKTMLKLMSERDELGIIADQIGSPTWARSLADAIWAGISSNTVGMHHWTGAGVASWFDFTLAILDEAKALGLLEKDVTVNALRTDQYPTAAQRPNYSVLETTHTWDAISLRANHWREDLRSMLRELT